MDAEHPHDLRRAVPDRIGADEVRRLSVLAPWRALVAIAAEWLGIAAAIHVASAASWWPVTLLAVLFLGARQHALTVIAHDASHFRLLPDRRWNDWLGNLLLAWPAFISVQGFRHFHSEHHRHLNRAGDGNRALWGTHGRDGRLAPEWRYPKTPAGLAWTILRRAAGWTGLFWIVRGLVGGFMFGASTMERIVRVALWAAAFWAIDQAQAWHGFVLYWIVPYCTWHVAIQYVRLTCEHSAVRTDDERYVDTRTTIPGLLGRLFVLPRNIGYHIEHHFYPSVPFYRLPELHARLMAQPGFRAHADVTRSILSSLRECTRGASRA